MLNSVSLIHNFTDGYCNIILSGDFNSRTSDCSDCIDYDLHYDLLLLPNDYVFDISRPRFAQDKGHTNSNGTAVLDFCKQTSKFTHFKWPLCRRCWYWQIYIYWVERM